MPGGGQQVFGSHSRAPFQWVPLPAAGCGDTHRPGFVNPFFFFSVTIREQHYCLQHRTPWCRVHAPAAPPEEKLQEELPASSSTALRHFLFLTIVFLKGLRPPLRLVLRAVKERGFPVGNHCCEESRWDIPQKPPTQHGEHDVGGDQRPR